MTTKDGWQFGTFRLGEPTPTTPEAALAGMERLAAAMHEVADGRFCNVWASEINHMNIHRGDAAAILAALDGWTLVRKDDYWDGRQERDALMNLIQSGAAEIDRLTRELDAARTLAASEYAVATADWTGSTRKDAEIARLRAALEHIQQWHLGRNFVCRTARVALDPEAIP